MLPRVIERAAEIHTSQNHPGALPAKKIRSSTAKAAALGAVALLSAIAPVTIALHEHARIPLPEHYAPALLAAMHTFGMSLTTTSWALAGIAGLFTPDVALRV